MRKKPEGTLVSDSAWGVFNIIADKEGYGDGYDDWFPWFEIFEAGYVVRMEE